MTTREPDPVSEDELHAFVDGELAPERARAVEAWLARNPEAAAAVAEWRSQNAALRQLFAAEPARRDGLGPAPRRDWTAPPSSRLRNVVAALVLVLAGGTAGWFANAALAPVPAGLAETLPQASRANYLVYSGEVRHPVEVGAEEEDHLVGWLGKRIGRELTAPDLGAHGFSLVGGRLVPFAGKPGAMLMYENGDGERLTVLIAANGAHSGTNFRFEQAGGVGTFYWIDDGHGYALSGALSRDRLLRLATAIHHQQ
ncbi:MAG: membrane protein [Alphaproteobacteria bacterium]|nr:MAG: membrane protein [Alphaproteobacteria bacterium]